jgi:hypothetical protein
LQAASTCEDAMIGSHRIKIKLGDAEFEAEGSEQSVQAQYELFLGALERKTVKEPGTPTPKANGAPEGERRENLGAFDDNMQARIFELRQDGIVALRVLPKGNDREADALILLLYGYRRLKNEENVLATHLLRAAQYSGVSVYRPAHALAVHDQFLIRGGQKKGSTYSLNNQGVTKAEEIAAKIFE